MIDLEEWRVGFTSGLLKQPLPAGGKKEDKEEAETSLVTEF